MSKPKKHAGGRPQTIAGAKRMNLYLGTEHLEALEKIAKKHGLKSQAEAARFAINLAYQRNK